jgi:hypothetical protein
MKSVAYGFLTALVLTAVAFADEADVRWKTASGTHFRILPKTESRMEAHKTCEARGWDVLNFDYLSDDEKAQLLESSELARLNWGARFVGEPGEHHVAEIWGSSEMGSNSASLLLYKVPGETKARGRVIWNSPTRVMQTVCMYQGPTWMRCRQPVECKYGGAGVQISLITEYGKTKPEAVSRINKRFETNYTGLGSTCALIQQEPYCEAMRPRLD